MDKNERRVLSQNEKMKSGVNQTVVGSSMSYDRLRTKIRSILRLFNRFLPYMDQKGVKNYLIWA